MGAVTNKSVILMTWAKIFGRSSGRATFSGKGRWGTKTGPKDITNNNEENIYQSKGGKAQNRPFGRGGGGRAQMTKE